MKLKEITDKTNKYRKFKNNYNISELSPKFLQYFQYLQVRKEEDSAKEIEDRIFKKTPRLCGIIEIKAKNKIF